MMPGACCMATGLALGVLALLLLRSARLDIVRNDLEGAWMTGAEHIRPPEMIYVIAGTFRAAQMFIRATGEDPMKFKIVLHPENIRNLARGARVVMLLDEYQGRRMREFIDWLAVVRADVRYVDLDQMTGVKR
jgi:hypothetical protein